MPHAAPPSRPKQDTQFVASLAKGMRVLEAFGADNPEMGLRDLTVATGLDKSAVQRFTATFHRLGFLERDEATRRYRLSVRFTEFANAYLWSDALVRAAMPKLVDLRQDLGETINLALLDGPDIVYVVRLPSARTNFGAMIIGRRLPALNTASGRVMLGRLPPDTRRRALAEWRVQRFTPSTTMDRAAITDLVEAAATTGYSIAHNEIMMNEVGIAVSIQERTGRLGAIQCSVTPLRWHPARIEQVILPRLLDAAHALQ